MDTGETRQPLGPTRQATVDALCEHFANDVMSIDEFERRVELAHRASTLDDLRSLLKDLPGENLPAVPVAGVPAPATQRQYRVTSAAHVKDREIVLAILGGASRKGAWTPARRNYAFSLMGGTQLDFREASLGPGVTDVQVFAIMGGVEIVVPPGVNVESHGIGLLGGFDHRGGDDEPDMRAPTLRITGLAVMGGVDISVRHPGESARDARRRRRLERREEKRIGDGGFDR
ncbi:MAG TPA: DUF1707 domain-containing protein [Longimicrobiales bacterium]|nr:DUF1707 domain-containing protein [Longimicrobiales bacterium]